MKMFLDSEHHSLSVLLIGIFRMICSSTVIILIRTYYYYLFDGNYFIQFGRMNKIRIFARTVDYIVHMHNSVSHHQSEFSVNLNGIDTKQFTS